MDLDTLTERYTVESVDFIRRHKDQPFFLYYASHAPHTYIAASAAFRGKSRGGLYGDMVEELDSSVGRIMKTLKELGLDKNTLVFFSNDNGAAMKTEKKGADWEKSAALFHPDGTYGSNAPLRGGKQATFEGGVRVPAIVWGPGVATGRVEHGTGIIMDFLPTILAAAGAELPRDRVYDGEDLTPVLKGVGHRRGHVFFFYTGPKITGIRSGNWKLKIESPAAPVGGKQEMKLLFDLDKDVSETHDLASEHPGVVTELLRMAEQFTTSLGEVPQAKK